MNANYGTVSAYIVQIDERRIVPGEITWEDGIITGICEPAKPKPDLSYLLPGFIDAHVHIESSMLTPAEFARIACRHGTVATVSDPHEIANVLGLDGVRFMIDNAALTPMPIFFGAPSCVPATPFETAGGRLESEQLELLFADKSVTYLSEMMNYPGVLNNAPDIIAKLQLAQRYACPIDGHAPGLTGQDAIRYAQAGISTDHECYTLMEAEAKLAAGMHILIREGSAARNFDVLHPLISSHPDKVMFCSDDKHPDDLVAGHINRLAARAVAEGHDIFNILRCACINPISHYKLPLGRLRVGDRMDAVEVDNLQNFAPLRTWIAGHKVAENNNSLLACVKPAAINLFNAREITPGDLDVEHVGQKIRVIKAVDGALLTEEILHIPKLQHQKIVADPGRDILLLTVVNRYRPAKPAIAFIQGFGLQQGALASSVAHDSHNIIAVGTDAESICKAVNSIINAKGGIAVATLKGVELLPLPIAGLMSDLDGDEVANRYAELDSLAKQMGSELRAPFMTLSFMALLVIPNLKLSDQGLFDSSTFQFTSLTV
ncbi:MAG: adenine deaminase [Methylobacter sp.]|nr:MAG: adenine deaminase [Methylobacter sp.]